MPTLPVHSTDPMTTIYQHIKNTKHVFKEVKGQGSLITSARIESTRIS